jgi:hypothetical protein
MEFNEPRRVNVVSIGLGNGIRRARQVVVQTWDKAASQWGQTQFCQPERPLAVVGIPEVVTKGVKITIPYGIAEVTSLETRYVPAIMASVSSTLFRPEEPGYEPGAVPVLSENEFRVRIVTLAQETATAALSVALLPRSETAEKVIASEEKPISLNPRIPLDESVLLRAGRLEGEMTLRFELRLQEPRARPFQVLEYRAEPAPPLTARLVFPGYRKSLFASQKTDEVVVEGLLGQPKRVIQGRMGLAVRLAVGRREYPYRLKEYRTTGMGGPADRRPVLRLPLKDTPPGHFKTILTTHAPPVMNQVSLAQDDLFIVPKADQEVWVDGSGLVQVNESPLFLIGFRDVPDDDKAFGELAAGGANVVHVASPGPETLQRAVAHKLRVIADLGGAAMVEKADEGATERLKQQIARLAAWPSLLGWSVRASNEEDIARLAAGYQVLREADPYHPVLIFASYSLEAEDCAQSADLLAGPGAVENHPLESLFHFVEEAHQTAQTHSKAVVAALPAAPAEALRCLVYGAIAAGATGILLDWPSWPDARSLVTELAELAPVFTAKRQPLAPAGNEYPFPAGYWHANGRNRLVVVNNLPVDRELSWLSPLGKTKKLCHLPTKAALQPLEGRFTDSFSRHEVRTYEVMNP